MLGPHSQTFQGFAIYESFTRVVLISDYYPVKIDFMNTKETYTVFEKHSLLFRGTLREVVLKVKKHLGKEANSLVLIFSDTTGKTMDVNFQGNEKEVLKRLEVYFAQDEEKDTVGPGRPKLGVISREVSLLPRHWEWLANQPGGASSALRKLVDEAKGNPASASNVKQLQERAYRFMSVVAGDLAGYEGALRALYRGDHKNFSLHIREWPKDVKAHLLQMTRPIFKAG